MDERIQKFIRRHHVMTLATIDEQGQPWCSNLFYAYVPANHEFVVSSSPTTLHAQHAIARPDVGVSIVLESKMVGKLQGLQICAQMRASTDPDHKAAFLKAFPYAVLSLNDMWVIEIKTAKYTDNTLGFGTKLTYQK